MDGKTTIKDAPKDTRLAPKRTFQEIVIPILKPLTEPRTKNRKTGNPTPTNTRLKPTEPNPTTSKINLPSTTTGLKQENDTNLSNKETNLELKRKGEIRISIHGTEVYSDSQIRSILHKLKASKAWRAGRNLITTEIKIGSYDHINDNDGIDLESNELCPQFDQTTQVNEKLLREEFTKSTKEVGIKINGRINKEILASTTKPERFKITHDKFINYTEHTIPEDVISVATLVTPQGRFENTFTTHDKHKFDTLKTIMFELNEFFGDTQQREVLRDRCIEHILNHKNSKFLTHDTNIYNYINNAVKTTEIFKKDHKNIIIVNGPMQKQIALDRHTLTRKINEILTNKEFYTILTPEAISMASYKIMNGRILQQMAKLNWLDEHSSNKAYEKETLHSKMYTEINEDDEIVTFLNTEHSIGFQASKTTATILGRKLRSRFQYDTKVTGKQIRQMDFFPDETLCIIKATSSFNTTTIDDINKIIKKNHKKLKPNTECMKLLIDTIQFTNKQNTEFIFDNKIYKQIKGLKRDKTLWPTLQDLLVSDALENTFLVTAKPKLVVMKQNSILIVTEKTKIKDLIETMNRCNEKVSFNIEQCNDKEIKFADLQILKSDWGLKTYWNEEGDMGQSIENFLSYTATSEKWSNIINLTKNIFCINQSTERDQAETRLTTVLKLKSYPTDYITQAIQTVKDVIDFQTHVHLTGWTEGENKEPTQNTDNMEDITVTQQVDLTQDG